MGGLNPQGLQPLPLSGKKNASKPLQNKVSSKKEKKALQLVKKNCMSILLVKKNCMSILCWLWEPTAKERQTCSRKHIDYKLADKLCKEEKKKSFALNGVRLSYLMQRTIKQTRVKKYVWELTSFRLIKIGNSLVHSRCYVL